MSAVDLHGPPQGERLRLENIVRGAGALGPTELWQPRMIGQPLTRIARLVKFRSLYMARHAYSIGDCPSRSYDLVIAFQLRMAPYALKCRAPVHILDLTDSLGLFRSRLKLFHTGILRQIMLWRVDQLEIFWSNQFSEAWVSGWQDQQWLNNRGISAVLVPNAVREKVLLPPGNVRELLFVANMAYLPNRLGLHHFLENIWPVLVNEGYILHVAGPGTERIKAPGVITHGFVNDLRALYVQAGICISPVELGTGTQNKILEALGYGRPVITGPLAWEALPTRVQSAVAVATTPREWLQQVNLLQDPTIYGFRAHAGFNAVDLNGYPVTRRLQQLHF
ncbi:glycosyltransferase [Sulfobacillus thermosulfidooxidans]|uniref:glycosyltransferase n=1 Tax=Sulfobacillus thermosulfidooxidans TaxID=28034 RepID=UPI0006B4597A|nr:glycosyltransferase [Sulfobacillus thermosulfidooxidans]